MPNDIPNMALFCDFENVALGVAEADYPKFDIRKVMERLLLKGSIVVKKAYCDWDRYKTFKRDMHEAAFELIEIPHVRQSGKNSADIRMVVDALDLCYTKSHVDCFVIISGDSDFSPLVSKLRENNKKVIGVGVRKSTSDLLIGNCDEFIFYDDLVLESIEARRKRAERQQGQQQARGNSRGGKPAGERGDKADDRSDKPAAERADKGERSNATERGNLAERGASADASAAERPAGQSRSSRSRRGRGRGEAAPAPADLFAADDGALPLSDAGDAAAMLDDRDLPLAPTATSLDDAFADDVLLAADDTPVDSDETTPPAASTDPGATVADTVSAAASDGVTEAAPADDNGSASPDTAIPAEPEPAAKPRRPARKRASKAAAASVDSDATLAIDAPAPAAADTADATPTTEPSAPAPKARASRAKPRSRKATATTDTAADATAADTAARTAATDSPAAEPAAERDVIDTDTSARPTTRVDASAATPVPPAGTGPETATPPAPAEPAPVNEDEQRRLQALDWVIETIEALLNERGADERLWGSMVKQTLKRRKPGFNEAAYGYRAFNDLLADAERRGLLQLERDSKSGGALIRLV